MPKVLPALAVTLRRTGLGPTLQPWQALAAGTLPCRPYIAPTGSPYRLQRLQESERALRVLQAYFAVERRGGAPKLCGACALKVAMRGVGFA